jgi:hypothetical protein
MLPNGKAWQHGLRAMTWHMIERFGFFSAECLLRGHLSAPQNLMKIFKRQIVTGRTGHHSHADSRTRTTLIRLLAPSDLGIMPAACHARGKLIAAVTNR